MKRTLILGLMMIWTVFCSVLTLSASPNSYVPSLTQDHVSPKFKPFKIRRDEQHSKGLVDHVNLIEGTDDGDHVSVVQRVINAAPYFIALAYATFIFIFFFFIRRKLPFCHFLASYAQHRYLKLGVLLI
ncbi:hypothetical protein [Sphingobacterium sp. MYb382]|uniref:hypothetical protein n=1 Tax=Sphingobacterium sp. MYb382 TaxID=2745278 RepID=UPI003098DBC6